MDAFCAVSGQGRKSGHQNAIATPRLRVRGAGRLHQFAARHDNGLSGD
jgi:hypothetical protein